MSHSVSDTSVATDNARVIPPPGLDQSGAAGDRRKTRTHCRFLSTVTLNAAAALAAAVLLAAINTGRYPAS